MAFNEMLGSDGGVRAPYAGVSRWLESVNLDQLDRRRAEAERSKEGSKVRKQAEEALRGMGARVFVEKGGKIA